MPSPAPPDRTSTTEGPRSTRCGGPSPPHPCTPPQRWRRTPPPPIRRVRRLGSQFGTLNCRTPPRTAELGRVLPLTADRGLGAMPCGTPPRRRPHDPGRRHRRAAATRRPLASAPARCPARHSAAVPPSSALRIPGRHLELPNSRAACRTRATACRTRAPPAELVGCWSGGLGTRVGPRSGCCRALRACGCGAGGQRTPRPPRRARSEASASSRIASPSSTERRSFT